MQARNPVLSLPPPWFLWPLTHMLGKSDSYPSLGFVLGTHTYDCQKSNFKLAVHIPAHFEHLVTDEVEHHKREKRTQQNSHSVELLLKEEKRKNSKRLLNLYMGDHLPNHVQGHEFSGQHCKNK